MMSWNGCDECSGTTHAVVVMVSEPAVSANVHCCCVWFGVGPTEAKSIACWVFSVCRLCCLTNSAEMMLW
jgi:hypothetical protein